MLATRMRMAGGAAAFAPLAVDFDGTNDYMTRDADLTGSADGKQVTVSVWFNPSGADGSRQYIVSSLGDYFQVRKETSNRWSVSGSTSGGASAFYCETNSTVLASSGWHHLAVSVDYTGAGVARVYLDGVSDHNTGADSFAGSDTDFTRSNHMVGARSSFAEKFDGDVAELYVAQQYIDLSSAANLAKFISGGKPVFMGDDGSLPTGTAPIMYHSVRPGDAATAFATNRGSGGNFSIAGALALSSTNPEL